MSFSVHFELKLII